MFLSEIKIENFRCFGQGNEAIAVPLRPGLTALVGENDAGKTAVVDAIRFVLGTTDQDWYRLEDSDFHQENGVRAKDINITCKFDKLTDADRKAFAEYLTYPAIPTEPPFLALKWTVNETGEIRRGRPFRRVELHSGPDGTGPTIAPDVRELLRATYLRPLRDAEQALSSGRGSRLAQVLASSTFLNQGANAHNPNRLLKDQDLSVLGIAALLRDLLKSQKGVKDTGKQINQNLSAFALKHDNLACDISVGGTNINDQAQMRELLEQLSLRLLGDGNLGLGSNNVLFMACELLLLVQDTEQFKMLLVEEPEAHLHAQRQLRGMTFLQEQADNNGIQIVISTHSPNLASVINLENLVLIKDRQAFPMVASQTMLDPSDYRFLQRFLDATKANLFFAQGVMIVEGDGENILLPTIAGLIERDFRHHGVSIDNVGNVGLRRYARVFQRRGATANKLEIPVACLTDLDVMPDCAVGKINKEIPTKSALGANGITERRKNIDERASGQSVRTFIADHWTLEYDLAFNGLARFVYVAAQLAKKDETLTDAQKPALIKDARKRYRELYKSVIEQAKDNPAISAKELLAAEVYAEFTNKRASKAIAAQVLADLLSAFQNSGPMPRDKWLPFLPPYIVEAIDYVTGQAVAPAAAAAAEVPAG